MTIREYLDNPSGKGAAVNSKVIYEVFLEKFKKYEEMKRDIIIKTFKYKKKYYIYAKLESQSVDKCYYQCVIELTPNGQQCPSHTSTVVFLLQLNGCYHMYLVVELIRTAVLYIMCNE